MLTLGIDGSTPASIHPTTLSNGGLRQRSKAVATWLGHALWQFSSPGTAMVQGCKRVLSGREKSERKARPDIETSGSATVWVKREGGIQKRAGLEFAPIWQTNLSFRIR